MENKKENLAISFSAGETSAYMTKRLIEECSDRYNIIVVMANTGKEKEESLEFARLCDEHFNFNTVWIEALVNPIRRKGTSFKVVDFHSASRIGGPFEDVIKKYGLPNISAPHCSRELKGQPIKKYIQSVFGNDYKIAIGIRSDEFDRIDEKAKEHKIIYPLIEWNITKVDINNFWRNQSFRLNLKGYEGNCNKCWKKSLRKLMTIEKADRDNWWIDMESKYGEFIPKERLLLQKSKGKDTKLPITFYRNHLSGLEIREMADNQEFNLAEDDKVIYGKQGNLFDLDISNGCTESCEVKFD
jgi:3'-phosphoadenosine 5'-phosphosulfate sulfotransferase (PAPS reductase)/FAD synthetase